MPATDKVLRESKTMHIVFAISSLILLGSTIWMLGADHADEWREYQTTFYLIEGAVLRADQAKSKVKQAGSTDDYKKAVENLKEKIEIAKEKIEESSEQFEELDEKRKLAEFNFDEKSRLIREKRSFLNVAKANYGLAIANGKPTTALLDDFNQQKDFVDQLVLEAERLKAERDNAKDNLATLMQDRTKYEDQLKTFESNIVLMQKAIDNVDPDDFLQSSKRTFMEWPIIDGFNSHHHIVMDWVPNLHQTIGMASTARFDRCRTCHLGIERTGAGNVASFPYGLVDPKDGVKEWVAKNKFPHPFSTHPRTDVYLSDASPHPLSKFGCTGCHIGQGSGTSFQNASHSPNDPHMEHVWHEKFGYSHNHFWEYPMTPKRFQGSACLKCHHSVIELGVNAKFGPTAQKVYNGWQNVRKYGCFGCHEINGFDGGDSIGPDLRLEPQTDEDRQKYADDSSQFAGKMRKVGPSLKHIAQKTTREWIEYWTEDPKRFRETTRMPRFFDLTNQHDQMAENMKPIELAAISQFLTEKSTDIELMSPPEGYKPNAERGRETFARRGCLACHSHKDGSFKGSNADFGPDLSRVGEKIKKDGFNWVYTWIRDPHRHHPRTRMPNLFLEPEQAADVAEFLLQKADDAPKPFAGFKVKENSLQDLVELFLAGANTTKENRETFYKTRDYRGSFGIGTKKIKGDEVELDVESTSTRMNEKEWTRIRLNYVGRRTISRYGCYGCHDIKGFESARPIGTTLQDWGRKDTSKLALEHIEQFLHKEGEPDGSSTYKRIVESLAKARAGAFGNHEEEEREMTAAYFYESLLHHGRPGFLWQKLRAPRSYDYEVTKTKRYDERLRMPKFPLSDTEIEEIAAFVLGLVAEPPAEEYLYKPTGSAKAVVEGERLLQKYNCTGCHIVDMEEVTFAADPDKLIYSELGGTDYQNGLDLLLKLNPPRSAETGRMHHYEAEGEKYEHPVFKFKGLMNSYDQEFAEYSFDVWQTMGFGQPDESGDFGKQMYPGSRIVTPESAIVERKPAKGGAFALWLVERLMKTETKGQRPAAWQMAPPPLFLEGIKVQTPWLFRFLKDPGRIREITVLRMPRFNMSDEEARALANYFAAVDELKGSFKKVDETPFPYQQINEREPQYLAELNKMFRQEYADRLQGAAKADDYLDESWKLLNRKLCSACHSVGGRTFRKSGAPNEVQGPNLDLVRDRLRPNWVKLWLYQPKWITPYTSMPAPVPNGQKQFLPLFHGDGDRQTIALRDALMNYYRLMGRHTTPLPQPEPATNPAGETN